MSQNALTPEKLRAAADALSRVARGDARVASQLVGEVLLAQAEQRSAAVSHALIDARMGAHGASEATAECDGIRPLDVLRHGPRTEPERALVSVLMARHLGELLDRDGGANTLRALLPGIDWLEFTGPYAPYSAARVALEPPALERMNALLREAPVDAVSELAAAAVRALRGAAPVDEAATIPDGSLRWPAPRDTTPEGGAAPATGSKHPPGFGPPAPVTLAGEVEGLERGPLARTLGVITGWSAVRGSVLLAARQVFSFKRPATLTLDGEELRILGHTELLGRTLRTFDVRLPVPHLIEVRREARFPALPAAASLVALTLGTVLGARYVIEGAGLPYFPLVAIGLGLILGGLVFDMLLRAVFPGVRGRGRLAVRASEARAVVITNVAVEEADRLLDAVDARFGATGHPPAEQRSTRAATAGREAPAPRQTGRPRPRH